MPKKIAKRDNINTNNLLIIRNISNYASVAVANFSRAENQEVCLSISHQHCRLFYNDQCSKVLLEYFDHHNSETPLLKDHQ